MIDSNIAAFLIIQTMILAVGVSWDPWGLTPTPPMGWANWNSFGCSYNDTTIRHAVDKLVETGLREAGYKIVLIQECITRSGRRTKNGTPVPDRNKFPYGMADLVRYIHGKGLLAGIYTDVGRYTCAKYEGSFGYEDVDALTYAKWGFDFVEVDACFLPPNHTHKELYGKMRDSIVKAYNITRHPMMLYLCTSGALAHDAVHEWGPSTGNLWRTTGDICSPGKANWNRMIANFRGNSKYPENQGPKIGWQDPDMMVVGMPGINFNESQSHFCLWAIAASPLWIGIDLTTASNEVLKLLSNHHVIRINQDPLGRMGTLLFKAGYVEVWFKILTPNLEELSSGAILIVNLGSSMNDRLEISINMLPGFYKNVEAEILDVLSGKRLPAANKITVERNQLAPHASIMLILSQAKNNIRNNFVH